MTVPADAKVVFKGIRFKVYQWQQEMFDKSKQLYEAIKRVDSVQVIAIYGGKIITLLEEQPTFKQRPGLIGGEVEEDEKPLAAAKRELLEEAGMVSEQWEKIKVYSLEGMLYWDTTLYVAKNCKKVQEQKLEPGEKIELKPVDFDEFIEIATSPTFRARLITEDIFRMQKNNTLVEFKKKLQ